MKAVVLHAPGDLRIEERGDPEPGPGQVLVRVRAGGICGSDLHYVRHGGFGPVRLKEPMILGHEIAGVVEAVGAGVGSAVRPGAVVAVNPSLPCGRCGWCRTGLAHLCSDMRFLGSAMRVPHVQGGFRELLVCEAVQAVPVAEGLTAREAALAEPLAVCLHALNRAGDVAGRRVLVTGVGPIGAFLIALAKAEGAAEVVATDVRGAALERARGLGASDAVDANDPGERGRVFSAERGRFDVAFDASGSPAAQAQAIAWLKPRGVLVQVGQGDTALVPLTPLVTKEIDLRGSFRFDGEFADAVALIGSGRLALAPFLTDLLPFEDAVAAFALAGDRNPSLKVQLSFA